MLLDPTSEVHISSVNGQPQQPETLLDIAEIFAHLDATVIELVEVVLKSVVSGTSSAGDVQSLQIARQDLQEIETLKEEFRLVKMGRRAFHKDYLKDRYLLYYWVKARAFLSQILDFDPSETVYRGAVLTLQGLDSRSTPLPEKLVEAARQGLLEPETRAAIRDKWLKLDETLDLLTRKDNEPRSLQLWSHVSTMIGNATTSAQKGTAQALVLSDMKWITILLWLLFISTVVLTIPTFSLAFRYSKNQPGTTKDADFWFLVQGCIMQAFNLVISGIPIAKRSRLPWYSWALPIALASLSAVFAPLLYIKLATEWSALVTVVVGAVQGFIVLQLAFVNE